MMSTQSGGVEPERVRGNECGASDTGPDDVQIGRSTHVLHGRRSPAQRAAGRRRRPSSHLARPPRTHGRRRTTGTKAVLRRARALGSSACLTQIDGVLVSRRGEPGAFGRPSQAPLREGDPGLRTQTVDPAGSLAWSVASAREFLTTQATPIRSASSRETAVSPAGVRSVSGPANGALVRSSNSVPGTTPISRR
mgnify:CR=1 FL=1